MISFVQDLKRKTTILVHITFQLFDYFFFFFEQFLIILLVDCCVLVKPVFTGFSFSLFLELPFPRKINFLLANRLLFYVHFSTFSWFVNWLKFFFFVNNFTIYRMNLIRL